MSTPNKKVTPASLARQFITLAEATGPTSNQNPHKCACFGGFCWRQLCHQKTYKGGQEPGIAKADIRGKTAKAIPPRLPKPKGQLSVWRLDGSHEQGRVAEGRIPDCVDFDAKGRPIIR